MRRTLVIAGISSALLVGGAAGMLLGNPLVSGAQTATAPADAGSTAPGPAGAHGDRAGRAHGMLKAGLDAAAKALGMTADELRTELRSGKTLGQVADDKGVSRTALVDALVAEANTRIDQAVADGRIPQDKADSIKSGISARITERLDRTKPAGTHRGHRGGHRWGSAGTQPATGA